MNNIADLLDSTYLKTAVQAGVSEPANEILVKKTVQEAIDYQFKLAMILPQYVSLARQMIDSSSSNLLIGTVIDFPNGTANSSVKLIEAKNCILNGADELDFVINYQAFISGQLDVIDQEVLLCTQLCLENNKTVKWIIETAALSQDQIIQICNRLKTLVLSKFEEKLCSKVFVKSSTGFYKTPKGVANGATFEAISCMSKNARPLVIKASGGVRCLEDVEKMVEAGASRIGTSSALKIVQGQKTNSGY